MFRLLLLALALPLSATAQEDIALEQYLWTNRLVVVFADTPKDPRIIRQLEMLNLNPQDLLDRDAIVLVDSDPKAKSALRTAFRPRGFMLVLVGKDGRVALRKASPWSTREITQSIDKWPLRLDELQRARDE